MGCISIPSAISNLVNLQTLIIHLFGKLRGMYNDGVLHFLPLEIWRMPQLRHLFFNVPYNILPHPLEGLNLPLENLQTLFLVKDLVWNEKILEMIPNIKRLGLTYTTNEEYHLYHLKDLHQLEKLEVIGYGGFSWRWQNHRFPCTLKKLTLVGGGSHWKDMAAVSSLPNLQVLKLIDHACDGETWETFDGYFPRLKFLAIGKSHLRQWIAHRNSLPTLERLVLRCCWYLKEIPESIGEITTLEVIEVDCCTESLVESAMKIKEDQESYGNYGPQVRASNEVIRLACGKLRGKHDDDDLRHSLPLEIWMLPQLRHLFFHSPYMLPYPIQELNLPLENLQTLLLVADLVWNEKIPQLIPNVKRLGLTYTATQTQSFDLHRLQDFHQLEKLEVIGYGGGLLWTRENPSFPCTLKMLTLVGGGFPWKDMAIVGLLPNLEILKLLSNACYGSTWKTNDDHFPRLKYLLIDGSYLEQWITQSNPFPTLKCLVLRCCWSLREIPEVIGEIPTLELIEVEYCTASLVESAKKIKEDQESYGNDVLQVVCDSHEVRVLPSSEFSESFIYEKLYLMFGDLMDEAPDYFLSRPHFLRIESPVDRD